MSRKSNVEFMIETMEVSRNKALIQAYMIQALLAYSDMVLAAEPSALNNGLIDGVTWQDCAAEIKEKFEARYAKAVAASHTVVMSTATGFEENRITTEEFKKSLVTRGWREGDGKVYWGTPDTISNVDAFSEQPRWATCVYVVTPELKL